MWGRGDVQCEAPCYPQGHPGLGSEAPRARLLRVCVPRGAWRVEAGPGRALWGRRVTLRWWSETTLNVVRSVVRPLHSSGTTHFVVISDLLGLP